MVVDKIYYSTHPFVNQTDVNAGFSFDESVIKDILLRLYEKKFNPVTEIDRKIWNETFNIFNQATDEGFGKRSYSDPDYEFYRQIQHSNAVFSAFRTHRLQNDIVAKLLDENGNLKSFEQFSNDVQGMTSHNVKQWLQTEYDTAILRAHQAADWVQFEEVRDILPNLRWLPTTSVSPDPVHKRYWETELTLPQAHPFWTKHRPGDRWNCKCTLEATDDPAKGEHVIDIGDYRPDKGLDNNPGVDGKLFSDTHPYYEHAHPGADEAVKEFIASPKTRGTMGMAPNSPVPKEVVYKIEEAEKILKGLTDYEQAYVFTKKGKVFELYHKTDNNSAISLNVLDNSAYKGATFIHNHPNGLPHSPDDLYYMLNRDMKEMIAVTDDIKYIARKGRKKVNLPDFKTFQTEWFDATEAAAIKGKNLNPRYTYFEAGKILGKKYGFTVKQREPLKT
jgi:hypothetical protein